MKILTLNTWQERGPWEKRWGIILKGLAQYQPDVAAFQEVFNQNWARVIQERAGYDHLVFPEEPGGLMLLSRFPVEESACLTMKKQSPTEDYFRYALYAGLQAGGQRIAFFNTHLSWRLDEGPIREAQAEELLDFMAEKSQGQPAFAMGDFNAPPNTAEIRKVMLEGGLVDLFGALHPKDPGLTWNNSNPFAAGSSVKMPDRRIDYIFMRGLPISRLASVEMVYTQPEQGIYASDHFGLLATFKNE